MSLFKRHARSPRNQGGVLTQGGGEHVKNSVPIPRGVHAARQKHAPCVESVLKLRVITTYGISKGVNPPRSPKLCMYFKNVCTCNILLLHIRYSFTLFGL